MAAAYLGRVLGFAVVPACDHVGLEKYTLKEDIIVAEGLEDGCVHLFADFLAFVNGVVSVGENFRLNDRHEATLLANGCITSQSSGILLNGR